MPLDLVLHFNTDRRPRFSIKLVWIFGLVRTEVKRGKTTDRQAVVESKPKIADWEGVLKIFLNILQTRGMPREIARLLRSIFRHLKVRELVANLKVGLDNPADTGLLFAFIAPLSLLASYLPCQIKVEPSFSTTFLLQGYLSGAIRTHPLLLIASIAGFAFSPPAIKAIKTVAISKWKGK